MSNNNLKEKKKKMIVAIVSIVVIVVAVVSVVFAFNSKDGEYTDTPVSDMNNASQNVSAVVESNVSTNDNQNVSASKPKDEKTTEAVTKPTTEKTTKKSKAKSRYIYVTTKLPIGSSAPDTLEVLIDGEVVAQQEVKVDGSSVTVATEEKYKGDIEVTVRLVNYGTSVGGKVLADDNSKTLVIPLNGMEEGIGKDE